MTGADWSRYVEHLRAGGAPFGGALLLIEKKMAGQYGLLPKRWVATLEAIRALPELERGEGL
jgi:hypothetical protein